MYESRSIFCALLLAVTFFEQPTAFTIIGPAKLVSNNHANRVRKIFSSKATDTANRSRSTNENQNEDFEMIWEVFHQQLFCKLNNCKL